jgi:hypothetical protein
VATACAQEPHFSLPDELWKPGLEIANGINEQEYTVAPIPRVRIKDRAKGELRMIFSFSGEVDNPMDLAGFPFDEDSIDIGLCGSCMRDGKSARASDFVIRAKGGSDPSFVKFTFDQHLPEFQLLGVSFVEYIQGDCSFIALGIIIRRKHAYYFFKVTILMWLIALLAMPTFLFRFEELGQRISIAATMFLATAATLYVVGQDLPKTPQLNKMDLLVLGTLGMLFAVGAESVAVFLLSKHDSEEAAKSVQDFTVRLLPALYVLLNIALFGQPWYRVWRQGPSPRYVRPEREFVPWKDVQRLDPWGCGEGTEILTGKTVGADAAVRQRKRHGKNPGEEDMPTQQLNNPVAHMLL